MTEPLVYNLEYSIPVPRDKLWRFVADTDRINRLAGLLKVRYEYRPLPDGGSEVHAFARKNGMNFEWIEHPVQWIEPQFMTFDREFLRGPFRRMKIHVELQPTSDPDTTRVLKRIEVTPRGWLSRQIGKFAIGVEAKHGFDRAYAQAAEWAQQQETLPAPETARAAHTAQRAELERRLMPVADDLDCQPFTLKLIEHLLEQPDEETSSLAPYRLADRWGLERRTALRFFLQAARAGAFDMTYNLLCPSCRRAKAKFPALSEVTRQGHCGACNIDFGVDFDRSIEVRFSPAPMGIGVNAADYCHAGPRNTPHRVVEIVLGPGETRDVVFNATPGKLQVHSPQARGAVFCGVGEDDEAEENSNVEITAEGLRGMPAMLYPDSVALTVRNTLQTGAMLVISRAEWAGDAATAADVTSLQEFRDLFGSEVVAPGAEFSIQNMVFLFSDLVDSTRMYERIGDARAFSLVRDHFDLLKDIYTRHNGSLVKTIGDAVMAVFRQPEEALRAAIEMHERIGTVHDPATGARLALKIGLHHGPCIAMEANGLLDYFGTTVNLAARVQAQAGAFETALSPRMLESPAVRDILEQSLHQTQRIERELKGLSGRFELTTLRISVEPATA